MNEERRIALLQAIQNKDIDKIENNLYYNFAYDFLQDDNYEEIKYVFENFKSVSNTKTSDMIFEAVIDLSQGDHISDSALKTLDMIAPHINPEELEVTDSEEIYQICQCCGNVKLIKKLIEIGVEIDENEFFIQGCNNNNREFFDVLTKQYTFSEDVLASALDKTINSEYIGSCNNNDDQNHAIMSFINKFNANVNQEGGSHSYCLFLECFKNAPYAAKYFYTDDFNSKNVEDNYFWQRFTKSILNDNDYKQHYIQAFQDLKDSEIKFDDSELLKILTEAGHDDLVMILRPDTTDA